MLIDQLLSNPMLAKSPTADLRGRLSKATKFSLRRDFAMAADELSNDLASINRALPLCRLPFRECWFELAQADRCSFRLALPSEPETAIKRVGFLFTETDQIGSWSALPCWSLADGTPADFAVMPGLSTASINLDYGKRDVGFMEAMAFGKADWVPEHITMHQVINAATNLRLREGGREKQITGEATFLIAMLALLNSRNASEVVSVDMTKQNKRRKLVGKPLLFDYRELCIPQRYKQRNVPEAGEDPVQLRAHFCRGHFKVRGTGVFFWSAHQRGNPSLGFAHKDYVLAQRVAA